MTREAYLLQLTPNTICVASTKKLQGIPKVKQKHNGRIKPDSDTAQPRELSNRKF